MEKLMLQIHNLQQALASLEDSFSVAIIAKKTGNEKLVLAAQDSTIQRFEYCYDGFWKFLKLFLERAYNVENANSPRAVFRACVECKLFNEEQGDVSMAMTDDRNETTHTYDFQQIRQIVGRIKKYYKLMQSVKDKVGVILGEKPKVKKPKATKAVIARPRILRSKRAK